MGIGSLQKTAKDHFQCRNKTIHNTNIIAILISNLLKCYIEALVVFLGFFCYFNLNINLKTDNFESNALFLKMVSQYRVT